MRPEERVHRGWTAATAFVIDVGLVGEAEAERRVLESYRPGVRVHALDGDHWLVVLPEPIEVDARTAPGMVLTERAGRLIGAPDLDDGAADVVLWREGVVDRSTRAALATLDPSEWIDVTSLPLRRLEPLDLPPVVVAVEVVPVAPADLRALAHVRERSAESKEVGDVLAGRPVAGAGPTVPGRAAGSGGTGEGFGAGRRWGESILESLLARLVLRTPLAGEIRRRQARYLERLAEQFDGDLDEALRNAIPLGGLGDAARTLRMPRRRSQLRISRQGVSRGSSMEFGSNVYLALRQMYARAAEQLEAAGRLEEAAFTYVELLDSPTDGVAMLERHERYDLAATIAEDRKLDPILVVRLWWLAGDRGRAVMIARRHRVFGSVIDRLEAVDPLQGRELRAEWVDSLERAGDILGAVRAGWPDSHLRTQLHDVLGRSEVVGGTAGAALRAYRIALDPSEDDLAATHDFLAGLDSVDAAVVRAFAIAMSEAVAEPAVDREFATLLLRTMTRVRRAGSDQAYSRAYRAIRGRADPMLTADLPSGGGVRGPMHSVEVPSQPPGQVAILDAAALPNDGTLVALGEAGCVLLTPDGRTAAQWEVATHRLVVADHGGSALLIAERGDVHAVVVLDLTTRKTRRYGPIRASVVADTFDGATWPVVDDRGVAFLDILADGPSVTWRELEAGWTCPRLARDENRLAALVGIPASRIGAGRTELWRWSLPTIRLELRPTIAADHPGTTILLLSDATLIWMGDGMEPKVIEPYNAFDLAIATADQEVLVSQAMVGVIRLDDQGTTDLTIHRGVREKDPILRVPLGRDGVGFRATGERVAAWDGSGRLVTADLASMRLITVTHLVR